MASCSVVGLEAFGAWPGRSMGWVGIGATTPVGLGGCIMASDGWFSFGLLLLAIALS